MTTARPLPADCPLTPRQFEVITLLFEGLTSKQIAGRLGIADTTVRTHRHTAYHQLDVGCLTQAMAEFGRRGWLGWRPQPPAPKLTALERRRPWVVPFKAELNRWLESGQRDERARRGMDLALAGARNAVGH
jgi:DNA-binding CsgD family transcriptional regulator